MRQPKEPNKLAAIFAAAFEEFTGQVISPEMIQNMKQKVEDAVVEYNHAASDDVISVINPLFGFSTCMTAFWVGYADDPDRPQWTWRH